MAANFHSDDVDELVTITDTYLTLEERSEEKRKRHEGESEACFDERLQKVKRFVDRSVDCIQVSSFLYDYIFHPSVDDDDKYLKDCISPAERSSINSLLRKKKEITERAHALSKENEQLEEKLFVKKMQLKDRMEERKESWNKAVKLFNTINTVSAELYSHEESETSECPDNSFSASEKNSAKSIYLRKMREEIQGKYILIQEISDMLHRLIIFSGVKWANQKALLDIVLCTGKIIHTTFNEFNLKEHNKFVIECILKLDELKWELM